MKRRTWILSAMGAAGALVVGWGALPARPRQGHPGLMLPTDGDVALNGWIKVSAQGHITLAMPRSEMGQGVHNALAMLVAEELDVPLAHVHLEQAGADAIYGNVAMFVGSLPFHPLDSEEGKPFKVRAGEWLVGKIARELGINATGGSSSVADAWEPLRQAAATARASLVEAAAQRWKVPVGEISIKDGVVSQGSNAAHLGTFAHDAAGLTPTTVVLKDRARWNVIGKPQRRADIPDKTRGAATFGLDVRLPDMLFASVRMAPMLGGTVATIDAKAALGQPGVARLVRLDAMGGGTAGFALVGKTTWHTRQAIQQVQVQWAQRPEGALDSGAIAEALRKSVATGSGTTFFEKGDVAQAEKSASKVLEADYFAPYLAHATMEPMNCTAQVQNGKVEVWAPTQVPGLARAIAARVAGVDEPQVTVHVTLLGGGFGRRLDVDFVAQAVRVAMECEGKPVQLVWSREEDMTHDFYRPMHVARLSAALDASGKATSLRIKSAGDAITPRWMERVLPALAGPFDTPDKTTAEGLFDLPYGFAHQHMEHVATRMGVPVGFWRSVGHSHNAFFSESFVDELAAQAGQDPVAYRTALLTHAPRYLAVLRLAAEKGQWGRTMPPGRAQGVALHESFGSIVAEVVEVSLRDGRPQVHSVVCAIDCGTVINPDTVAQQMESAVVYGLSAALYGRIDIQGGEVQQNNFPGYPVVQLAQAPMVQTWIVPSTRAPSGVGEPGVPPLAPAVANALFTLTGKRQRSLPLVV